ncbi:phosphopentomutase [Lentibacillus sediminis]|uniref:phosphopentomutase n=1 Tax=Lentibacillus sediminis TaxID=1940529 RepID=UPI000C1C79E0|nr:phosphopentomutase [Lentibacillus sediminis]
MAKVTVLIIDSFGIGAMEDYVNNGPSDWTANTYKHIRETKGDQLKIPFLYQSGLGTLVDQQPPPENVYGSAKLAHHGADTYLGHQEIAGSCPKKSTKRLMKDIHSDMKVALEEKGYSVSYPLEHSPVLLVNDAAVVADNLESSLGNIINVTADFQKMPFEEVKRLGEVVRENVDTSRVIAFGGPHTSIVHILSCVKEKQTGQWGVDTPRAKVYGEGYQVYHMGYGVDIGRQFPKIAAAHDLPVYRLGKTADVLHGDGPKNPIVNTGELLETVKKEYQQENEDAAFLINIQETDLAGHAEDTDWYCRLLNQTDAWLQGEFMPLMQKDDILIIMADHGNDPTIGHANHTREYVPILILGRKVKPVSIGTRETMADVGASLCAFFDLPETAEGESFLDLILDR